MRDDQAYRTPSEVLDDVMDVDWNLMVNEVRVQWGQFQRTRIRNQAYKMAKAGKDPLRDKPKGDDGDDYNDLVNPDPDEKGVNVNIIKKRGQIKWESASTGDGFTVPIPEKGDQIFRERQRTIDKYKVTANGVVPPDEATSNKETQLPDDSGTQEVTQSV